MTPRWLLPVVASGAALAVGVTAAIVGAQFAAPEVRVVDAPTIEAPVLAPVDSDATLAETLGAAGEVEVPVSPVTGLRTVVDPDAAATDPGLPADIDAMVEEMATADDPETVPAPPVDTSGSAPAGDPCAGGAEGCPEGVGGTIIPLDGELPWFQMLANAAPTAGCRAPEENGTVRFPVLTSEPASITVRGSDGHNIHEVTLETDHAGIDRWLDDGPGTDAAPTWIEHCVEIPGFGDETLVILRVQGSTADGRSRTVSVSIRTDDGLAVPPTRIRPIGTSTVFVSAPHTAAQDVEILLAVGDAGTPQCTYGAAARSLHPVEDPRTEEVGEDYLAANGFEPAYTRRTSATFVVPPGSSLIACVGWFPRSDTSFFGRQHPVAVSEFAMVSPDISAPRVTVSEVAYTRELPAGSVRLRASTENGVACGSWTGPEGRVGAALCDFAGLLGWRDPDGALVVRTEVDTGSGEAVNTALLDISVLTCGGSCAGRVRSFDVPLSTAVRPTGLCSGSCDVDPGEIVGVVRLTATWPAVEGEHDSWALGEWHEGANRVERDPAPPMDVTERIRFGDVDAEQRSQDVWFRAVSDRPVSVSAQLTLGSEPVDGCPRPGAVTSWTSATAATTHRVEFSGLCLGARYLLAVTLTDARGASSTYSWDRSGGRFWVDGEFGTYTVRGPVVIDDLRFINPDPGSAVWLESARVEVAYADARLLLPDSAQRCWVGDIHGLRSGTTDLYLGERIALEVRATITPATAAPGVSTPDFPTRACGRDFDSRHIQRLVFTGSVTHEEYLAGTRVTLTDPDSGWTAVVELSPDLEP